MTIPSRPLVSIIVPVRNGAATIGWCIESLLAQDYPHDRYEVIVVDNGSTDATVDIVRRYPVRLLSETSIQSSYVARNKGIEASRGDFLAFTDGDCIADKGWLAALLGGFETPEIGGVAGRVKAATTDNPISRFQEKYSVLDQERFIRGATLFRGAAEVPFAATGNVAYRLSVFDQVGLFDEAMMFGGDVDFGWRMHLKSSFRYAYRPEAVVEHFHQRTVRGHYRQMKRYATSHVYLAKKYPDIGPNRSSLSELAHTYGTIFRLLWKAGRNWIASRRAGGDSSLYMESLLGALTLVAHQVGFFEGSIRYRYWYI